MGVVERTARDFPRVYSSPTGLVGRTPLLRLGRMSRTKPGWARCLIAGERYVSSELFDHVHEE